MQLSDNLRRVLLTLCCSALLPFVALSVAGQNPTPQGDDVVRVNTDLVQTDVMVFDRRGHFVEGLRPEQFALTLDGVKRPISLISRVTSGSQQEAAQLAATRSGATALETLSTASSTPLSNSGRLIFFFVDDVHLGGDSLARCRKALMRFVDQQLGPKDQVAVVSTSGQVGFLSQLTDNQVVLHAAIARLVYKRNPEGYAGKTRITEYMASRIVDQGDRGLFAYLMESVKIEYGMGLGAARGDHGNDSGGQAARLLKSRLGQIRAQSKTDTTATMDVLRSLMQSSAVLPGRKLIFLLSDGFVVDPRGSNAGSMLREVTQAAARSGAVIYTMDTRGTFGDAAIDVSTSDYVDMTSRHGGVSLGESTAPREPLNVLAEETGGRAIFNSNSIDQAIQQAVKETSDYYVLAWRPDSQNERNGKSRIEVTVEGRPDLRVRLRRNYFVPPNQPAIAAKPKSQEPAKSIPETQLLTALGSAHVQRGLPTALSVGFVKSPGSQFLLQAAMQIDREAFNFAPGVPNQSAAVDVIGAAIDDRGLIYTFKQVLTVLPQNAAETATPVMWTQQLTVQPGLYQVRIAVRDRQTGHTGSAIQWVEVPAADQQRLTMSSLFLGERQAVVQANDQGPQTIRVDVDHRFARTSVLRFQTYVYNAAHTSGVPDVLIEAKVLRGSQQVFAVAPNRIPPEVTKDPARLPYWTEIALDQLPSGEYTLQVSATDRATNRNASQRVSFSVE